ncbi:ras-like protein [Anaeramoeba ignava]|uniref:Ras-like protein n=1 Tax=Anaeramoeba ignava TaxID=1746090 RepID=A0A9Q0LMB1_ANAIG|nr:ras-like protein [Anaeramoeba ignava]
MNQTITVKIAVLGLPGVGKSNLVNQILSRGFFHNYDPFIEDTFQYSCCVDNELHLVYISDSGAEDGLSFLCQNPLEEFNCFILVFSIVDLDSFLYLKKAINYIYYQKNTEEVPILIVGNKIDLIDQRKVLFENALEFSNSNNCLYWEISTKNQENCNECLIQILRENRKFPTNCYCEIYEKENKCEIF